MCEAPETNGGEAAKTPPDPAWEAGGFVTAIFRPRQAVRASVTTRSGAQSGAQSRAQSDRVLAALMDGELSAGEMVEVMGLRSKTGALKRAINQLRTDGLVEYTLPDEHQSRLQKYRLTAKGIEVLGERGVFGLHQST